MGGCTYIAGVETSQGHSLSEKQPMGLLPERAWLSLLLRITDANGQINLLLPVPSR